MCDNQNEAGQDYGKNLREESLPRPNETGPAYDKTASGFQIPYHSQKLDHTARHVNTVREDLRFERDRLLQRVRVIEQCLATITPEVERTLKTMELLRELDSLPKL